MAQRHRGRDAGLARKDLAAVFGGQRLRSSRSHSKPALASTTSLRQLDQAKGLGHLAGAGLVVPRGAADQQDASGPAGVVMLPLRPPIAIARVEPLDGQLELRIGETWTRLPRPRALAILVVVRPGHVGEPVDLAADLIEGRVAEALEEPAGELVARQLGASLSLPDIHGRELMHAPFPLRASRLAWKRVSRSPGRTQSGVHAFRQLERAAAEHVDDECQLATRRPAASHSRQPDRTSPASNTDWRRRG